MKQLILFTFISLTGCSKEWTCTSTYNGEQSGTTTFKGTKEEKEQFEQDATSTVTSADGTVINIVMTCK